MGPGGNLEELRRSIVTAMSRPGSGVPSSRAGGIGQAHSVAGVAAGGIGPGGSISPVDHLPRAVTDFVGRGDVVLRLLAETRRVEERVPAVHIIDGMAGSGKTALAVHLARRLFDRYPDAALFIDLCGHGEQEPGGAGDALVTLLRLTAWGAGRRVPVEFDDRVELWRQELARRRAVVVLDNAASSEQIMPLLPAEPTSVVVVTSRRRHLSTRMPGRRRRCRC